MADRRFLKRLAQRVRQLRAERGLTQEDMIEYGFNIRHYQRIEAGEKNLSVGTILKLAKAFKLEPWQLLKFDD